MLLQSSYTDFFRSNLCRSEAWQRPCLVPHHVLVGRHMLHPHNLRWQQHEALLQGPPAVPRADHRVIPRLHLPGNRPLTTSQSQLHCWCLAHWCDHSRFLLHDDMGRVGEQGQATWAVIALCLFPIAIGGFWAYWNRVSNKFSLLPT